MMRRNPKIDPDLKINSTLVCFVLTIKLSFIARIDYSTTKTKTSIKIDLLVVNIIIFVMTNDVNND